MDYLPTAAAAALLPSSPSPGGAYCAICPAEPTTPCSLSIAFCISPVKFGAPGSPRGGGSLFSLESLPYAKGPRPAAKAAKVTGAARPRRPLNRLLPLGTSTLIWGCTNLTFVSFATPRSVLSSESAPASAAGAVDLPPRSSGSISYFALAWADNGGRNATPTADLLFMNPATDDTIRANVKVGKTNLLPSSENESTVLFNTLAANGMVTPFAQRKEVKKFAGGLKSKMSQVLSQIEQKAGMIRESKDDVYAEATQLYDEVAGKIEDLMALDKGLKKAILREILTGELQFGPESLSTATHVIATNKDGTSTQLQPITNYYISRLSDIAKMNIIFAPANIEERVESEQTPGDTFVDYIRMLTQGMEDKLQTDNILYTKPSYEPGTDFGLDASPDNSYDLAGIPDPFDGAETPDTTASFADMQAKQDLSAMVRNAIQNMDGILDIMRFFNIGVESIDIDPVNLTTLNDQRSDKYNIVTVDGKRFRIPVDRGTQDLMDDFEYIENAFNDIIMEGRKVRKYKKGDGKCGTGSDSEWCYQRKKKKYRAELQQYNRDNGTHGNGDKRDASHKNGKISGFEDESKNRSRNGKGSKKRKKLKEEHGAGDEGTTELLLRYLKDTPYSALVNYKPQIPLGRKKKDDRCGCEKS